MLNLMVVSVILLSCGRVFDVNATKKDSPAKDQWAGASFQPSNLRNRYDERKTEEDTKLRSQMYQTEFPSNCAEALRHSQKSGIYTIQVDTYGPTPFKVYCDAKTYGGNWTVIQRRQDGYTDFLRKWSSYKKGFGFLQGEFFIGLDKLHALTTETPNELLIQMEDFENATAYAKYDLFAIGDEDEHYALNVLGPYSGNAGDSLAYHKFMKFSTIDRPDESDPQRNCAIKSQGAWWYRSANSCEFCNLNGLYLMGNHSLDNQGVEWWTWRGKYYSLKYVQMLIRPKVL